MLPSEWIRHTDLPRFRLLIRRWYLRHGRDLPWRCTTDPYRVWVSEIMLQQTQVATVLGYYERFLGRFPNVQTLAAADEADVLHLWQGLGYYARARNLHQAARIIVAEHGGKFPRSIEAIRRLPGLGRYTANAIASFARGQRLGILEANTIRFWTRQCAAAGDPKKAPLHNELWELATAVLPARTGSDFNQALMDLGSEICTPRSPACDRCPVRRHCQAYESGTVENFPPSNGRRPPICLDHVAVVLRSRRGILVHERPRGGRWGGLCEFPTLERQAGESWESAARRSVAAATTERFRLGAVRLTLRHSIMHYRIKLKCFEARTTSDRFTRAKNGRKSASSSELADRCRWMAIEDLPHLPFSSPQRRIVASLATDPEEIHKPGR